MFSSPFFSALYNDLSVWWLWGSFHFWEWLDLKCAINNITAAQKAAIFRCVFCNLNHLVWLQYNKKSLSHGSATSTSSSDILIYVFHICIFVLTGSSWRTFSSKYFLFGLYFCLSMYWCSTLINDDLHLHFTFTL